jgi:putative flippase GtrA
MPRPAGLAPPAVIFWDGPVPLQTPFSAQPARGGMPLQRGTVRYSRAIARRGAAAVVPAPARPAALPFPTPMAPFLLQFFRYGGAGAVGTALQFVFLAALVQLAGLSALAASTVGAIAGAVVNYALNYRFTFESRRAHRVALPRFCAISGAGILLNAAVLAAMLAYVHPHYLVAQIVATAAVLVAGFLANRRWTF